MGYQITRFTKGRAMRLWVLLAALSLVVAACGSSSDSQTDTTVAAGDSQTDTTVAAGDSQTDTTVAAGDSQAEMVTISVVENAVRGGNSSSLANWYIDYAIPTFEIMMADNGTPVTVEFIEGAVGDEDYKTRLALDLSVGKGADVMGFDQFWTAEFAAAELIKPLNEVVGPQVDDWDGWTQIPDAVGGSLEVDGERYGVPFGTDGRVLYFRTDLFEQAGLSTSWQPTSWDEILEAARTIQSELPGVIPIQLNAGVSMGEATTLQGFIPILLGTGQGLLDGSLWYGDTPELRQALSFFETIYGEELGDVDMQLRADGRERSFQAFSEGKIAILAEGDYFWRGVVSADANFPVENREEIVGFAKIPAMTPGSGIRGQGFVSASGGTGRVMNPNTEHPDEAWAFMSFLGSKEALTNFVGVEPRITARSDVNEFGIEDDPLLTYVAEEVLPITWYRPGFETYPPISESIQLMVENVVAGRSTVAEAAEEFNRQLEAIVGSENIVGG